jgi:hypothetical protein
MQISDSTIRFLDRIATGNWQVSVVDWGFEMRMSATEPWIVPGFHRGLSFDRGWLARFRIFHQGKENPVDQRSVLQVKTKDSQPDRGIKFRETRSNFWGTLTGRLDETGCLPEILENHPAFEVSGVLTPEGHGAFN